MNQSLARFSVRALAVGAAVLGSVSAFADISNVIFSITATSSEGTASWNATIDQGSWVAPGVFQWSTAGVDLMDGDGDIIASLGATNLTMVQDPVVALGFHIQAGAADTLFTFGSGLLGFPGINGATGYASTGITLTDSDGDGSTSMVGAGGAAGTNCWQANYNGLAPAGTIFAEFLPGLSVAVPGDSETSDANTGAFLPIPGTVSAMSVAYNFVLSANDSASGTSVFNVVPEPATLALLAGGLLLIRRR